jgi:hypothetical protein
MLEAEQVSNAGRSNEDWDVWQRAATDYWSSSIRAWRGFGAAMAQTPTVEEMRERAEIIARAMDKVPDTWRLAPPSRQRAEHLAHVGWFHEQGSGLYGPIAHALERLRHDDPSGIETLVRFLESDVYCFRSGYMKAEVIRFLTRADLDAATIERPRVVVLAVVDDFDRREFRAYIRLSRRVDSAPFREDLRSRLASRSPRTARHADWVLVGLGESSTADQTAQ